MSKAELRVWWIPQIPGKPFTADIASIAEGVRLMDVLARYDLFQFEQRIKPDYANAGGIQAKFGDDGEWQSFDPDDEYELAELREYVGGDQ